MAEKKNMSTVVGVRFTDAQYAPHEEAIAKSGLKPARYFRDLVLSRSPTFEESGFDKKRMLNAFEKAGHALNRVAHLANSAPYKGALYQTKYLHWLSRLTSIQLLLHTVLPTTDPPIKARAAHNGNRGSPGELSNKIHAIYFRLTQDELAQFDHLIKRTRCTASAFFRALIVNNKPVFKEFTGFKKRIVFIVNKAGNNITQLAYIGSAAFDRAIIAGEVKAKWLDVLVSIEALLLAGIEYAD
ncbi:plasmid mobilization protein [Pseudomonas helleri]|uniref:plasmid mobilization protein n=1 Tax=Pseudomonas helleri TaxID=1608996 RepID=UPI003FCF84F4